MIWVGLRYLLGIIQGIDYGITFPDEVKAMFFYTVFLEVSFVGFMIYFLLGNL